MLDQQAAYLSYHGARKLIRGSHRDSLVNLILFTLFLSKVKILIIIIQMLYSLLNCLTSVGSLALIVYGSIRVQTYGHSLWILGLAIFFLHPLVFESLLGLKALLCRSRL